MLSDINFFKIIWKTVCVYTIFMVSVLTVYLGIILSHTFVICINNGVDFLTAIGPLHKAITSNNWYEAYLLVRPTVILELPIVDLADKLFISKNSDISLLEICSNVVKAIIAGFLSYILCRLNFFISSTKHKILFNIICGIWDIIAQLGTVVLIAWIGILDQPLSWIVLTVIVILMFLLNSFLPYNSLNNHHLVLISMKKCFELNIKGILSGILNGIFISFIIYILHNILIPNMTNQIETAFIFIMICFVTTIIFEFLKRNILKL